MSDQVQRLGVAAAELGAVKAALEACSARLRVGDDVLAFSISVKTPCCVPDVGHRIRLGRLSMRVVMVVHELDHELDQVVLFVTRSNEV